MEDQLHSLENLGLADRLSRTVAHGAIRTYQLTLSSVFGRHCRHLPTCSSYVDEAISRHGLWPGGWMGAARVWRCRPFGSSGFDPPPRDLPLDADWRLPWRYGRWSAKSLVRSPVCEPVDAARPPIANKSDPNCPAPGD